MKIEKNTIDKVLNNKGTIEQSKQVVDWFSTEEGSEYLSERILLESESISEPELEQWTSNNIPTSKMEKRFTSWINKTSHKIRWQLAAAVILPFVILFGASLYLANREGIFSRTEYAEFIVPKGQQMQVALQDGTIIQLNSDTRLRYPKHFGLFNRTVELLGEGYFKVAKDKSRPFYVDLNGIKVKVTGTHFDVRAYRAENKVSVRLDEGEVFLEALNRKYHLSPGEIAQFNRLSGLCEISRTKVKDGFAIQRPNGLNFNLTRLSNILDILEKQYNVKFIVKDTELLESRFTLSTNKVVVKDILKDLELVSNIHFIKKGDKHYILTSKPPKRH